MNAILNHTSAGPVLVKNTCFNCVHLRNDLKACLFHGYAAHPAKIGCGDFNATKLARIEAALFDALGYFKNEVNADDDGYEIQRCNNCGHFQHDLHVKFWCRLHKFTRLLMEPGCEHWSHWELHQ